MDTLKCQKILSSIVLVFFMESIAFSSGSIQGTITDTSSNPVSSAVVIAWQGGESKGTDTTSYVSGDGAYLISGLTAGTYELRVRVKGYEYRIETGIVVVDSQQTTKNITNLAIEGIISGKITLSDGTTGISDAKVSAIPVSGSMPRQFAFSDGSGNYSIDRLPAGTYDVKVYKYGYSFDTIEQKTVTAGNTTSNVNFSEPSGGTISGTVTNGTSGMMVCSFTSGYTDFGSAVTDTNGDYSIKYLPSGTYTVRLILNDYEFEDITGKSVTVGQTTVVNFTGTSSTGEIAGKLTKSDNTTPIPNMYIIACDINQNLVTIDQTDVNGDYELKNLVTGTYEVTTFVGNSIIKANNVSVTTGSTTTKNLSSVDGAISGTVKDSGQNPIEDSQVLITKGACQYFTTLTDSNGNYCITGLEAGTYNVSVLSVESYIGSTIEDVTVQTNTETTDQDFTLATGGTISGTVSDGSGALAGVSVTAVQDDDPYSAIAVTDENGDYSVGGLPTGTYILVIQADGYVSDSEDDVSVTAGQDSSGHNFTLGTSGGTISGTVYESDGTTPIEYAWVSCYCEDKSMTVTPTDSNGDYSLPLLQAGTYEVGAVAIGFDQDTLTNVVVTGTQENSGNDFSLEADE